MRLASIQSHRAPEQGRNHREAEESHQGAGEDCRGKAILVREDSIL